MIFKTIKKVFDLLGLQVSRKVVKDENTEMYQRLYSSESINNKRFYNVGAGAFNHSYWTNIDFASDWHKANNEQTLKGINYDLFSCLPIPVESNVAEVVYSSHTIEHVNDTAVQNLFNEAYRMLKPGGFFRIATPDIDIEYRAYIENDRDYFYWLDYYSSEKDYKRVNLRKPLNEETTAQVFLENFASQASEIPLHGSDKRISDEELKNLFASKSFEDAMNYCTSLCSVDIQKKNPGNHINWFNQKKLFNMLTKAGFKTMYRSAYGQSFCPILRDLNFFDYTTPKVTLYVEAKK